LESTFAPSPEDQALLAFNNDHNVRLASSIGYSDCNSLDYFEFGVDADEFSICSMRTPPRISDADERFSDWRTISRSVWRNPHAPEWFNILGELQQGYYSNCAALLHSLIGKFREKVPEKINGELSETMQQLQAASDDSIFLKLLGYAVYLSTNSMIDPYQLKAMLNWLMDHNHFPTIVSFLRTKLPTIEAFSHSLFRAAIAGCNITAVNGLLQTGLDFKETINTCALEFANVVRRNNFPLVKLLLKCGIDVNMKVCRGTWDHHPTTILAATTNAEMVQILIEAGAHIDAVAHYYSLSVIMQKTVLQHASSLGNIEIISVLLDAGADVNTVAFLTKCLHLYSTNGVTALMAAVEGGHLEAAQLLLERGANVNQYSSFRDEHEYVFLYNRDEKRWNVRTLACPLQIAAKKGNFQLVRLLLDHGADVNAPNLWCDCRACDHVKVVSLWHDDTVCHVHPINFLERDILSEEVNPPGICTTPLAEAIESGNIDIVVLLLEAGAEADKPLLGRLGTRTTHAAKNNPAIMSLLVASGVVIDYTVIPKDIQLAVWRGDLDQLKTFADSDVNVSFNMPAWNNHRTLLYAAIHRNDPSLIRFLLNHGVNVNPKTWSVSPLQKAVLMGNFEIVKLLCEAGADADATTEEEIFPPLQIALRRPSMESPDDNEYTVTPKMLDLAKIAGYLLDLGVKVDFPANPSGVHAGLKGGTPLQEAISNNKFHENNGKYELVQRILKGGADVNAECDAYGGTALQLAIQVAVEYLEDDFNANVNSPAIRLILVRRLLDKGADVNAAGGKGTALQLAARHTRNSELIDIFLKAGADINAPPSKELGRTVLQAAALSDECSFEVFQKLLDAGADIHAPACPWGGVTALQGAAIQGHIRIAKHLIELGADVNAPASLEEGRTALEGAAERGRLDMVQLLLNAGADSNLAIEERYRSSARFARRELHFAIAHLLESYME
jgi:ankyrin repeat protein